jgi:hypothetical protein
MGEALKMAVQWGFITLGVVVLLWPVLWVDPLSALGQVSGQALTYAAKAHGHSNLFWGQIRPDPGPAFYRVVWAFRTTPWVMLGLLLALMGRRNKDEYAGLRSVVLTLGGFGLIHAVFVSLSAKKFDRYLLPAFVFVDLLAAAGWAELVRRWLRVVEVRSQWWLSLLLVLVLVMAQVEVLWSTHPYYYSCYNPVLDGVRTVQGMLLVDWGEGLEKVAS